MSGKTDRQSKAAPPVGGERPEGPDGSEPVERWPTEIDQLVRSLTPDDQTGAAEAATGAAAGATRWRVGGATVYRFPPGSGGGAGQGSVDRLVEHLAALDDAAPFAIAPIAGRFENWLVTGRPAGQPADRPDLHADPDDLVVAIGHGLRALHDSDPPFNAVVAAHTETDGPATGAPGPDSVLARCSAVVAAGLVDSAALPAPYSRYRPDDLLAMLADGDVNRASQTTADDVDHPVWCHGSAEVERFVVDGGRFTGFDRMEWPLVADRHFDLATLHHSVQRHFGPEAVFRLYEAYGRDPNLVRLDHNMLAVHLLGGPRAEPT